MRRKIPKATRLTTLNGLIRRICKSRSPLFLALLLIEFGDALFAIDSVPTMLSVSHETFAVYSSDMFAVLGLRALYFMVCAASISLSANRRSPNRER